MPSVPCPYFHPLRRADWLGSYPRLPLAAAWAGACHAPGGPFEPQGALLFEACNTGFGRARCHRFPPSAGHDAVRFHLLENSPDGALRVRYVLERNCWPAGFGDAILTASGETVSLPSEPASCGGRDTLVAQILAFAASATPCTCT
jgi:hypothetical protein